MKEIRVFIGLKLKPNEQQKDEDGDEDYDFHADLQSTENTAVPADGLC